MRRFVAIILFCFIISLFGCQEKYKKLTFSDEMLNENLINKTLIQMKTKIENYKITKTISKIEKLN